MRADVTVTGGTNVSVSARRVDVPVTGGAVLNIDGLGSGGTDSPLDKNLPSLTTGNDGDPMIGSALSATPLSRSAVWIEVNGVDIGVIGDGTRLGVAAYFSRDGGATALARAELRAGDVPHFNGSVAGYQLEAGTDSVSIFYEV